MAKNDIMPEGGRAIIGWVMIGGIIALILLIMAILFGNLSGNVGFNKDSSSYTNETITLNASATPASAQGLINGVLSSITMTNSTGGETVPSTNYTSSGVFIINGTSEYTDLEVNVSYTVTYDEQGKIDTDNIIMNYTSSATNTAKQLPVTGTIVGIALLLLVLLFILGFAVSRLMKMSGGGSGSFSSSGSSNFKGSSNSEFA